MLTNWNDYRQADPHRRAYDRKVASQQIALAKQNMRNRRKWLSMAKDAITKGDLDVAIARIEQAKLLGDGK